jgi:WD40 repeat protein
MNNEGDYFASIGPESNCAIVWNSKTFGMKNRIPISNHFISKVTLINKNILAVILENCSVHIFSLATFEGILIKEFNNVHIEKVNQFLSTNNYKFLISGGEEGMIKIWDFRMIYKNYTSVQQFIGHSSGIKSIVCIDQKSLLITVSENDGIFFWNFLGDLTFCDSEILKEIEKFGEKFYSSNDKDKSKKSLMNKSSSMKSVSHLEKSYKLEHNDTIEKRLNLKKEKKEEKQILRMLPIDKETENKDTLDLSSHTISSSKKQNVKDLATMDYLENKLLFSSKFLPVKIEKL